MQMELVNKKCAYKATSMMDPLFQIDQQTLFDLILAANYLDIKGLLHVTCGKVADMMRNKSAEEIRRTFNIKNDLDGTNE